MLHSRKPRHVARPSARARRLEDQPGDVLAAHALVTANGLDSFAATRALEKQDMGKFSRGARGVIKRDSHLGQDMGQDVTAPYPRRVISRLEVAGFLALEVTQTQRVYSPP